MGDPENDPVVRDRVVMYVYNDVRTDARVLREATSIAASGRRVTIIARPLDPTDGRAEHELRPDGVEILRVPVPSGWRLPWRVLGAPLRLALRAVARMRGRSDGGRTVAWLVGWRFAILGWARAAADAAPGGAVHHGHDLTGLPAASRAAGRDRARLVYDAHELFLDASASAAQPAWARRIVAVAERRWASRADAIVTVNDGLAEVLRGALAPERLVVVHNCPPRWSPRGGPDNPARVSIGLPRDIPLLLYHGSVAAHRGLPQLVAALDRPGLSRAHLMVLAVGRPDPAFLEAVERSSSGPRIHVLPAVSPDDLLGWVAGADVAVMPIQPSTLNHVLSTPNKLFEALAAGVPVVSSDFPAMRRIVIEDPDGPLGAVCDPTDPAAIAAAVRSILELDEASRADLRRRCLRAAHERWNWETEGARLLDLYAVLDPPGSRVAGDG